MADGSVRETEKVSVMAIELRSDDLPTTPGESAVPAGGWTQLMGTVAAVLKWPLLVLFWIRLVVLAVTVAFILVEVFARYVLNHSITSSENILVLLFMWLIFLSLPDTVWEDNAPRLSIFGRLGGEIGKGARGAVVVGAGVFYFGYVVASFGLSFSSQITTSLEPLGWSQLSETAALPIGCGLAVVYLLAAWARRLGQAPSGRDVTGLICGAGGAAFVVVLLGGRLVPGLVLLLVLMGLGAPIGIALGVGAIAMVGVGTGGVVVPANQLLSGASDVTLLALPLFMLMGGLIARTELAASLARFVRAAVGWVPGGVGVADVLASGIFANMTGNATADTAAMGSVFIPQMVDSGQFTREEAAGVQASAGVIGVVFPPALAMIIYSTVVSADVVMVFAATLIPALLLLCVLAATTALRKRRYGFQKWSPSILMRTLPAALPVLFIPAILDGGIFSGVFSPFESGGIAVSVVVCYLLVRRRTGWQNVREGVQLALNGMIMAMFILVNVSILNYGLVTTGATAAVASFMNNVGHSRLVVLLFVNIVFIVIHSMVDVIASILVFVPLVLPAVMAAHISVLQFAAVIAINSTLGVVLPPMGIGLYVASGIGGVEATAVVKTIWPYLLASTGVLILVCAVPALSMSL